MQSGPAPDFGSLSLAETRLCSHQAPREQVSRALKPVHQRPLLFPGAVTQLMVNGPVPNYVRLDPAHPAPELIVVSSQVPRPLVFQS